MRKPCKTKRCANLAVVGGAYCLVCRRKRRRKRAVHLVHRGWSIDVGPRQSAGPHMYCSIASISLVGNVVDTASAAEALPEASLPESG